MTPLTSSELEQLKALAEKATPGPWYHPCLGIIRHDGSNDPDMGIVDIAHVGDYRDKELLPFNKDRWDADAAFIASFNPATALRLLAQLKAAEDALA